MGFIQSTPHSRGTEQVFRFPLLSNADLDNRTSFNHHITKGTAPMRYHINQTLALGTFHIFFFIHLYHLWRVGVINGYTTNSYFGVKRLDALVPRPST